MNGFESQTSFLKRRYPLARNCIYPKIKGCWVKFFQVRFDVIEVFKHMSHEKDLVAEFKVFGKLSILVIDCIAGR